MRKLVVVSLHIGFWLFIILAFLFAVDLWLFQELVIFKKSPLPFSNFGEHWEDLFFLKTLLGVVICCAPPFYLSYFFIKPKLIDKKRFLYLFLLFATILVLFSITFLIGFKSKTFDPVGFSLLFTFFSISLITGIIFRYLTDYTELKRQKELAEKHQIRSELALLKSQISPHFLFNTLNNIDVLITKDSEKASVYMKKLSDILRFMLYETTDELIPMARELEYIKKYIELQKIRTSNISFVNFSINGNADELNIAPMIFIPFIENAFKHVSNKKAIDAIKIRFDFSNDTIKFNCENFKNKSNYLIQKQSGLGVNLIEQRLKLLYKDKHTLKIENSEDKYSVSLTIQLNEN